MKEKRTYSLTAKERKEKRLAEQKKTAPQKTDNSSRAAQEQSMIASQQSSKRVTLIVGLVACIAIILILVALIAPVIAYVVNPYRDYGYVVARFELDNDMTLEFKIEEDEYDIAATNFIFLAKNGYFDNTVLFDAGDSARNSDGWIRFGGYEQQPDISEGSSGDYSSTHHHSQNETYCRNFSAIPNDSFKNVTDKFGYNLYADKNGESTSRLRDIGVLSFLYDSSSTEFQMSYKDDPSNQVFVKESASRDETSQILKSTMVGFALNDKTIDNLKRIASSVDTERYPSIGAHWNPPAPTVRIKKVKVYNLNKAKWSNFDFIDYMNTPNDNGPRLKGWTGRG